MVNFSLFFIKKTIIHTFKHELCLIIADYLIFFVDLHKLNLIHLNE